ncbi:hypothetical protein AB0I60_29715 [Actinosynnema sp. NPDC050436]|uniref:hypothetical protein n=1 Tax=Actinosynnema sp. NPDC050436 TaxID=3155659 RepID=UPI0033EB0B93
MHGHVEVLGCQNTAVNLADGPNSMVLHPPATGMTQENSIPAGRSTDVPARMVAASDPTRIAEALHRVPEHKRPVLRPELFAFYAEHFPQHTIALCCFDNAEARRARPLLLWYHPNDPDLVVLPALDCHTGGVPDRDAEVGTDHCVLLGSTGGNPVAYDPDMRHKLRAFLPDAVVGTWVGEPLPNGDFAIARTDLAALGGSADLRAKLRRVRP